MATRHVGRAQELKVRSADGTRLHVEVRGPADGPTVVLSHCWATSLASWGPVVRELDPSLRVVLYDQRGHGRTQAPITRAGYGTEKLADDLCAVLEATVPEGHRALVAGHSMGGMTVMATAPRETFKEKVGAVLLTNTGCTDLPRKSTAIPLPGALGTLGARIFLTAPLPLGPPNALSAEIFKFLVLGRNTDKATKRLCAKLVHDCGSIPRGEWGRVLTELELDDSTRQITAPTVVVGGDEDKLTPAWHAHHIGDLVQNCEEVRVLPGLGHMGPLEAPKPLAELIDKLTFTHIVSASRP
ncbi:hydrolase [Nocardiopsis terrae]|uniref:Pimeloyl-ACP methyl ester carboxylesterase n=1 Tax=Nocardiopsis terrae TaxID=372655 RepID=A0ABR9HKY2_9ACTN|nr:alpha/beta hydrolase [Nocardiopsis terrae]MBE1459628.1 pimeloyl-ACP methyl ester carboxylesterase [Nocardiopsis terrae]GHC94795.1 hydrolase [Nocardiopsis terrae]